MAKQPQLDHVIVLLPYKQLQELPEWVTKHFTVSEGGKHADGKTENKLILFQDGTYVELIAFINDDPEKRKGHWWDKPFGVVDFALTNLDFPALTARLAQTGTGISYDPPKAGGRTKPDGTQLEWEVTFPTGTERGSVPFWCEDVTPRERRVPVTDASTRHPSGVLGMGGVSVEVEGAKVEGLGRALGAICESGGKGGKGSDWEVGVPREVEGARKPVISLKDGGGEEVKLTLVLQGAERSGVEAIRERIGEGIVAIDFV